MSTPGAAPARDPAWEAVDRLGTTSVPAPGWWGKSGLRTREALRGEIETSLQVGIEPRAGIGGGIGWSKVRLEQGTGGARVRGWLVVRGDSGRLGLAVSRDRWGVHHRDEIEGDVRRRLGEGWIAGAVLRLYPGEPRLAPWTRLSLAMARETWLGLLESGSTPGAVSFTLGLKALGGVTWKIGIAEGTPMLGFDLGWSGFEIRVREERHPWLGQVTEVRLLWGGFAR